MDNNDNNDQADILLEEVDYTLDMEERGVKVFLPQNPSLFIRVIPGHFATNNSHTTHYIDMSEIKTNSGMAKDVARELSLPYINFEIVDTIVCMEGTAVIGAYLAEELLQNGTSVINGGGEIHVLRPMISVNGDLLFPDNKRRMIQGKNVLLLVASVSSGRTARVGMECISYYGGNPVGISALFSTFSPDFEQPIHAVFTTEDIFEYQVYDTSECVMCMQGDKLDAIVNSEGYTRI